jgi:alpha-ketoglutarate-dependent taurine dioxygenase
VHRIGRAYEAVPAALKDKLTGKKALHIHEYNRARQAASSGDISGIPHYVHPVFITHPDTGRKTLFVDRLMTTRIEGVDARRVPPCWTNSTRSASGANSSSSTSGSSEIS